MSKDTPDLSPTTPTTPEGATPVTPPAPAAAPKASTPPARPAAAPAAATGAYAPSVTAGPYAPPVAVAQAPGDLVVQPVRPNVYARLGAEALGTFIFVFVGLGVMLYSRVSSAGALGQGLGFGLAMIAALVAFGHISGGHFNPAVTIGSAIAGRTPWIDVPLYWLAQLVGGFFAAVTLYVTIPSGLSDLIVQSAASQANSSGGAAAAVPTGTSRNFFTTAANGFDKHSVVTELTKSTGKVVTSDLLSVMIIVIIATAVLVGIVLCTTNRPAQRSFAPVAIGLAYAALIVMTTPITNGAINPATSTAAAIFSDGWAIGQLWLFWLAPIIGAALAGLAYRAFAVDSTEGNLLEEEARLVEQEIVVDGEPA